MGFRFLILVILATISLFPFQGQTEYRVFRHKITKTPAPNTQANPNSAIPQDTTTSSPPRTPAAPIPDQSTDTNLPSSENQNSNQQAPSFRIVESTLDPNQYSAYYPLAPGESLEMIATWRCFGRTDQFQNFCKNPKEKITTNP